MVQVAFCDLSHTFHKQITNVSQHVFVILLWGILTSHLTFKVRPARYNIPYTQKVHTFVVQFDLVKDLAAGLLPHVLVNHVWPQLVENEGVR